MTQLNLEDGKYTIILDQDGAVFKALRHGEEWRDLAGDNLIYALVAEIERLQEVIGDSDSTTISR